MKPTPVELAVAIRRSSEEIGQLDAFKRGEDAACTSDAPSPKRSLARKLIRSRKETP